jgi:hypothetical protein
MPDHPAERADASRDSGGGDSPPVSTSSSAATRTRLQRFFRKPLSIVGTATVGVLVSVYLPKVIDSVTSGEPVPAPAIHVTAGPDNDHYLGGFEMAIPGRIEPGAVIDTSSGCQGGASREWLLERGGVDVGRSYVSVVLQAPTNQPVSIKGIRVEVLDRSEPLATTYVSAPDPIRFATCSSVDEVVSMGFNLDEPGGVARRIGEFGVLEGPWFASSTISLRQGESMTLALKVSTCSCHCTWRIAVDSVVDGEERVIRVEGDLGPFETTAPVRPHDWIGWEGLGEPVAKRLPPADYEGGCTRA